MMISRYIAERRETLSLSRDSVSSASADSSGASGISGMRSIETRDRAFPARASESALGVFRYRPKPRLKAAVVAESGELSQRGEQNLLGELIRLVAGERVSDRPAVDAVDVIGEDHLVHCHQHPFASAKCGMAGFHWVEIRKNPTNFRVIRQRGAGRLQTCRFIQRIPESSQLKRQVIHPLIFPEKLVINPPSGVVRQAGVSLLHEIRRERPLRRAVRPRARRRRTLSRRRRPPRQGRLWLSADRLCPP